jgi:hypothetical protein
MEFGSYLEILYKKTNLNVGNLLQVVAKRLMESSS